MCEMCRHDVIPIAIPAAVTRHCGYRRWRHPRDYHHHHRDRGVSARALTAALRRREATIPIAVAVTITIAVTVTFTAAIAERQHVAGVNRVVKTIIIEPVGGLAAQRVVGVYMWMGGLGGLGWGVGWGRGWRDRDRDEDG